MPALGYEEASLWCVRAADMELTFSAQTIKHLRGPVDKLATSAIRRVASTLFACSGLAIDLERCLREV